jgi:hypothetical protein
MRESKDARSERHNLELWQFVDVLRRAGNDVQTEYRFHDERRWRFDVALPSCKFIHAIVRHDWAAQPVAIEIEGMNGRHQRMAGFKGDIEKYAEAFAMGWNVLRVTREMIANGEALDVLARAGVNVEAAYMGDGL